MTEKTISPKTPFHFQSRNEKVNWRQIHDLNVQRIQRRVDVKVLQEIVNNLTFAEITDEDWPFQTDGMSLKLFQLCQLVIEYQLYIQSELVRLSRKKQNEIKKLTEKNKKLEEALKSKTEENETLKERLAEKPKYTSVWPCPHCRAKFKAENYLKSHIQRRHPELQFDPHTHRVPPKTDNLREFETKFFDRLTKVLDSVQKQSESCVLAQHDRINSESSGITEVSRMFETMIRQQKELYQSAIAEKIGHMEEKFSNEIQKSRIAFDKLSQSEPVLVSPPKRFIKQEISTLTTTGCGELEDGIVSRADFETLISNAISDIQIKIQDTQNDKLEEMKELIKQQNILTKEEEITSQSEDKVQKKEEIVTAAPAIVEAGNLEAEIAACETLEFLQKLPLDLKHGDDEAKNLGITQMENQFEQLEDELKELQNSGTKIIEGVELFWMEGWMEL